MNVKMEQTRLACWKCGHPLWKLDPPVQGWSYHCQQCQHLTSPRHEIEEAMRNKADDAVGVVSAVACKIGMK